MKRCVLALVLACGCTPSTLTRAALQSDLPALRRELERARVEHRLDSRAIRELAEAIARRELLTSQGEAAVARIRELSPCLGHLRADVQDRAEADQSGAAATANLALLEAGLLSGGEQLVEQYLHSEDPMWRAVAARALVKGKQLAVRPQLFIDGDLRVRRAALHAALDAPRVGELEALLEVARLDPDPLARSLAVRGLAKFEDERAVRGLRELWGDADPALRQGIVDAWADTPHALGNELVRWVIETQTGLPQVVAAARAHRSGVAADTGLATLGRAIQSGASDEQRLALRLAPASPELVEIVLKAAQHSDVRVQVAAQRALLAYPAKRDAALTALRALSKSAPSVAAHDARGALVEMRDAQVAADILPDLASTVAEVRASSALQLVALKRYQEVAARLADDVASVRTRIACALLASAP
jgi:HEAT repeats